MNEAEPRTVEEVIAQIRSQGSAESVAGMARYGINTENAIGVSVWELRRIAKRIDRNHDLAIRLWDTKIHECRLLAGMLADPNRATDELLERWVKDLDSWDLCDQTCGNLFAHVTDPISLALRWSTRPEEFVKRAGFALMCELAWHRRDLPDSTFDPFLDAIVREADDDRNFVKKAVNWALRNIGKRNTRLNERAIEVARRLRASDSRSARWIGADALRELTSPRMAQRLGRSPNESGVPGQC